MKERQKLNQRDTYTSADALHRKSIVIKGEEKKMIISIKKVKLVKFGKGLRFTTQFFSTLMQRVFLEDVR
ncbi:MAG: hypothetical protein AMDU4_FER2C00038G0016 [Ferroplasma sp. Type II]|jgi:hypothetical protein|uniref:hypothetical protein n=1 Tax=Ferroplasma sp. Type II TaxID=261388 RepID=UPI0003895C04|nr:hypothetical protein [Ferroplasma sp. Type II]EQB73902.1 MAG: hypothetical protein AMDU4_FER2C00038G0016 [Ferroplasma sp. Type II]HII83084.1 hypothetical protein [Ferroplasma sp.]